MIAWDATDVGRLLRLSIALKRAVERALPWYDHAEVARRTSETERVRQRSVRARINAEAVAERYRRADRVLR